MRLKSVMLVCTALLALPADEVRLADGRVLEGEVISRPDADVVDLRTGSGSMVVIQHFARSQILAVTYGSSPRQKAMESLRADRLRLDDDSSAEAWWALAQRARELGDTVTQRELAAETIARDRNHGPARKALGHVRQRGVWMRPHEAAVSRGEVLHQGRYMTWPEREAAVAQAAHEHDEVVARRVEREKEARERRIRAAAESAAYYDPPTATVIPGYRASGTAHDCRVVYWPGYSGQTTTILQQGGSGLSVSGGGHGNGFTWGFTWR